MPQKIRFDLEAFLKKVDQPTRSVTADGNLRVIAKQLKAGQQPQRVTVRTFVSWFGNSRRTASIEALIDKALKHYGLRTEPDFRNVYIDTQITFVLLEAKPRAGLDNRDVLSAEPSTLALDLTACLSQLKTLTVPTSVKPEQTVSEALTVMMRNNYSQLPVMSGERAKDLKGAITFASIAKRPVVGALPQKVGDCMERRPRVLDDDTPLFDAVEEIIKHDFILVQGRDQKINGIVTPSDLSRRFNELTEPFLLLRAIEGHVRALIERAGFSTDELRAAVPDEQRRQKVSQISDLTLGEYVRLIGNEGRWQRLELKLDRAHFVRALDDIREIRNKVMHFSSDLIEDEKLESLRTFQSFLQELRLEPTQSRIAESTSKRTSASAHLTLVPNR